MRCYSLRLFLFALIITVSQITLATLCPYCNKPIKFRGPEGVYCNHCNRAILPGDILSHGHTVNKGHHWHGIDYAIGLDKHHHYVGLMGGDLLKHNPKPIIATDTLDSLLSYMFDQYADIDQYYTAVGSSIALAQIELLEADKATTLISSAQNQVALLDSSGNDANLQVAFWWLIGSWLLSFIFFF